MSLSFAVQCEIELLNAYELNIMSTNEINNGFLLILSDLSLSRNSLAQITDSAIRP
jgi:hypothetical protein